MKDHNEKKSFLKLQPENIPAELKPRAQWVVWRAEERGDKIAKIPYCSDTGHSARVNDPSTSIFLPRQEATYKS